MNATTAVKAANQANAALAPLAQTGNAPLPVNRAANNAIRANKNRAVEALNKLREANVTLKKAVENAQAGNKKTINAVLAA